MEKIMEQKIESHEDMIGRMAMKHFGENPEAVDRITIGICNEVYNVVMSENEIIARLSAEDYFLKGSSKNIPVLKEVGVAVPEILSEDYSKKDVPYSYQFMSKLPGKDLGVVIESLTEEQLKIIAKKISDTFNKVSAIPTSEKFGLVWGDFTEFSDTWTERMKIWIDETIGRGVETGVIDEKMQLILLSLYKEHENYFGRLKPMMYLGDICSKNVMINNGEFSGVVDLDGMTQGDPLEAIGRIKASWPGTKHGEIYTNAIMDEQNLNEEQRKMVLVYALLNRISWASENGIQFNQNTKAEVDEERLKRDGEAINILWEEYDNIK